MWLNIGYNNSTQSLIIFYYCQIVRYYVIESLLSVGGIVHIIDM